MSEAISEALEFSVLALKFGFPVHVSKFELVSEIEFCVLVSPLGFCVLEFCVLVSPLEFCILVKFCVLVSCCEISARVSSLESKYSLFSFSRLWRVGREVDGATERTGEGAGERTEGGKEEDRTGWEKT